MNRLEPRQSSVYELTLLQFRPDATSEEFLNIGVVAFSPDTREFEFEITHRYKRLRSAFPYLDGPAFYRLSHIIRRRCTAISHDIEMDALHLFGERYLEEIMNRLISQGSANFGWSTVRYGTCTNLRSRVLKVFDEYVRGLEPNRPSRRLDDDGLWRQVTDSAEVRTVLPSLDLGVELVTDDYAHVFTAGWMNGKQQVVEAISLDYQKPSDMVERAVKCSGVVNLLQETVDFEFTALITNPPLNGAVKQYRSAYNVLSKINNAREVIPESEKERFALLVIGDVHPE